MNRYIVADTETTGLGEGHKIVELAWAELDDGLQVIDKAHSLIDPQRDIPFAAQGVHHIEPHMVEDAPTIEEFFTVVKPGALNGQVIFIAHNADFDIGFLKPFMPNVVAKLDTLRAAKHLLPDAENFKLTTLMYQYELPRGKSHSAAGDVETTVGLVQLLATISGATLEELAELSQTPIRLKKLGFGMHRDAPVEAVPSSYWSWYMRQKDKDRDVIYTYECIVAERARK